MLKTAMFDELDEGTAMFKLAPTAAQLPAGASLVPLDADGRALPSDFYLRVGGAATALLRGDLPILPRCPSRPERLASVTLNTYFKYWPRSP